MENRLKRALLCAALIGSLAGASVVQADDAAGSGLGGSWPNTQDVSANASLHAYRWVRGGVLYVQVNDANGAPLMAIATNGQMAMVLPIGHPELVKVSTVDTAVAGDPVVVDPAVVIQTTSSGFSVQPTQFRTAQICRDPVECSGPAATTQSVSTQNVASPSANVSSGTATTTVTSTCRDPIECSGPGVAVPQQ